MIAGTLAEKNKYCPRRVFAVNPLILIYQLKGFKVCLQRNAFGESEEGWRASGKGRRRGGGADRWVMQISTMEKRAARGARAPSSVAPLPAMDVARRSISSTTCPEGGRGKEGEAPGR